MSKESKSLNQTLVRAKLLTMNYSVHLITVRYELHIPDKIYKKSFEKESICSFVSLSYKSITTLQDDLCQEECCIV